MQECEKPCRQCADKEDRQVGVDDVTNESHKMIKQMNCTNQSHKSITQDGMMS